MCFITKLYTIGTEYTQHYYNGLCQTQYFCKILTWIDTLRHLHERKTQETYVPSSYPTSISAEEHLKSCFTTVQKRKLGSNPSRPEWWKSWTQWTREKQCIVKQYFEQRTFIALVIFYFWFSLLTFYLQAWTEQLNIFDKSIF